MYHVLTRLAAKAMLDNAVRYAISRSLPVVIAVVDDAGHLVVLERINGTQPGAIDVAIRKATTAAIFRRRTQALEQVLTDGRIALLSLANMMPVEGGLPIVCADCVIGGIGVSGVASVDDEAVAAAAFDGNVLDGITLSSIPPSARIFPAELS